jgi:predicted secreted protein
MAVNSGRTVLVKISDDNLNHEWDDPHWETIGQQRGGSLERSTETADATHKGTAGAWASSVHTRRGWSVSVDGVLDATGTAWGLLYDAWVASTGVPYWFLVDGSGMSGATLGEPSVTCSGTGFITSLTFDFPEADIVSFSVEIQGSGALAIPVA